MVTASAALVPSQKVVTVALYAGWAHAGTHFANLRCHRPRVYHISLAASGSPNGAHGAAGPWPQYDAATDANVRLDADGGIATEFGRREKQCDFWETTPLYP